MNKIDEICDLGAHANLIVPPSWVVRLPPKRMHVSFPLVCVLRAKQNLCTLLLQFFILGEPYNSQDLIVNSPL